MDYVKAFIVGGLICAAVQILLDRTKLMPGRVMVLLVCGGALLGFCGLYDPFQKLAGAGAGVPLPGFGNVLWQGVKEAVDKYILYVINYVCRSFYDLLLIIFCSWRTAIIPYQNELFR